jgi:hypothetical protein
MALSEAQIQAGLDAAYNAYLKATKAASYTVGNRSKTNQQIDQLFKDVEKWEAKLARFQRGGPQLRGVTAR